MIQCLIQTFTQNVTDCFIYFQKNKQFIPKTGGKKEDVDVLIYL